MLRRSLYQGHVFDSSGEKTHSLEKASELRQRLARLYNDMEAVSKRIASLKGTEEEPVGNTAAKLHLKVRAYTIAYIQEASFTLPALPDQRKLEELVSQKEQERKRKIQQQLQRAQVGRIASPR